MKIYFPKMISFLAIATMLLTACGGGDSKKDDPDPDPDPVADTVKPVITTTLPAATGQLYGSRNDFEYSGTFTDNEELKEVLFTLEHNKTPGAASLKVATGVDDDPWTPTGTLEDPTSTPFKIDLSGKSQTLTKEVLFNGANAEGKWTGTYTLTITCKDKAGNSVSDVINVTIE